MAAPEQSERADGHQPVAQPRVTQKDVARRAGVAISSVSYVLNNGPRSVSADTRTRVLEAIATLGYRPNEHARQLIRQNWGSQAPPRQFGVILADSRAVLSRPYYSALMVGLLEEAADQNYALRFMHLYDDLRDPVRFNQLIHPEAIAGIVLIHFMPPAQPDQELLEQIVARVGNVVCLDFSWPDLPSIFFDRRDAGRRVVDYLISLGHRRIGYVGKRDERFDGYLDSLRRHEIPFDPALLNSGVDRNTPWNGWLGAGQLLGLPALPTALFAASDEVASGALRAAREHGLRVPEDLSIVGIDDLELASYTSPPLTTMRVPTAEMAAMAVRVLIERIGRTGELPISMMFPVKLVERASSGPWLKG